MTLTQFITARIVEDSSRAATMGWPRRRIHLARCAARLRTVERTNRRFRRMAARYADHPDYSKVSA